MNSLDLNRTQAERLYVEVREMGSRLHKLRGRMRERGFPDDDVLCHKTDAAFQAVHALGEDLHWLTCGSYGTGMVLPPAGRERVSDTANGPKLPAGGLVCGAGRGRLEGMSTNDTETRRAVSKMAQIAETVSMGPCEAAPSHDGQECPQAFPQSEDDWCLRCLAKRALEQYLDA